MKNNYYNLTKISFKFYLKFCLFNSLKLFLIKVIIFLTFKSYLLLNGFEKMKQTI